jgi:hypothetical protein
MSSAVMAFAIVDFLAAHGHLVKPSPEWRWPEVGASLLFLVLSVVTEKTDAR